MACCDFALLAFRDGTAGVAGIFLADGRIVLEIWLSRYFAPSREPGH